MKRISYAGSVAIFWLLASPAFADCSMSNIAKNRNFDAPQAMVDDCIEAGAPPPQEWLDNAGQVGSAPIHASGTSGFGYSSPQEFSSPPGAPQPNMPMGAPVSVGGGVITQTNTFPPWRGFPCTMPDGTDICGAATSSSSSSGGSGSSSSSGGPATTTTCPVNNDPIFGLQQALSSAAGITLNCGGSLGLTDYYLTLNPNPTGVIITEFNSRNYRNYRLQGSGTSMNYGATTPANAQIPNRLCTTPAGWSSNALQPFIAQMAVYGANTASIALRLRPPPPDVLVPVGEGGDDGEFEFDTEAAQKERYLIIRIVNGQPQFPTGNCWPEASFRALSNAPGDLIIESSRRPGCESGTTVCRAANESEVPPASNSCDVVTVYPGLVLNAAANAAANAVNACSGNVQYAVINRPNLIYPPQVTPTAVPVTGRTEFMANTTTGSTLVMAYDTVMYLGPRAPDLTYPEGATIALENNDLLVLNGPATIRPQSRSVTMPRGGQIVTRGGTLVQSFPENSVATPAANLPYAVQARRDMQMPQGYQIPTQPSPTMRMPVIEAQ